SVDDHDARRRCTVARRAGREEEQQTTSREELDRTHASPPKSHAPASTRTLLPDATPSKRRSRAAPSAFRATLCVSAVVACHARCERKRETVARRNHPSTARRATFMRRSGDALRLLVHRRAKLFWIDSIEL